MKHLVGSRRPDMVERVLPGWQSRILDAAISRVAAVPGDLNALPTRSGGWLHQYVCPDHALPLVFDLSSPVDHRCPSGEIHQGEVYDAAFRVHAHRHFAALARDAAEIFRRTSDLQYFNRSFEILSRYAACYQYFDGARESQPWMLKGKAFHQALTEAIWAVPLATAFDSLQSACSPVQVQFLSDDLLRPVAETLVKAHDLLVFSQNRLESNYTAWLIAAIGCIGFTLGDGDLVQRAVNGPGGFVAHLNAAILPDGFEYEGSPYYHNFVAWAYTLLAEAAAGHGVDLYAVRGDRGQSIQGMWAALESLSWADGSLPCVGDGSYWQDSSFDSEICEVYEIAFARTGDLRFAWLLDCAYRRLGRERDSWAALRFANRDLAGITRPELRPVCLPDVGLAVLRDATAPDSLACLLRFGPYGGSHTHLDMLSLQLFPFSLDSGNPPYGAEIRRAWYQQSAAHNTVLVDGESQAPLDGKLLAWDAGPGRSSVQAAAPEIYPGVEFSRAVSFEDGRIIDRVDLSSQSEHIFDWLLHLDAPLTLENVHMTPAEGSLFSEGAGALVRLVSRGTCPEGAVAVFVWDGRTYRLTLSSPVPLEVFLAHSPRRGGVDMGERRTLIARVRGHQAAVLAEYEAI